MSAIASMSCDMSARGVVSGSLGSGQSPEAALVVGRSRTIWILCRRVLCRFRLVSLGNPAGHRLHEYRFGARCL